MTRTFDTANALYGHVLRPLTTDRQPATWIALDTEANREAIAGGEVQTFALACAVRMRRPKRAHEGWRDDDWHLTRNTLDLWRVLTEWCPRKSRTGLIAHNLGYDLRISRAFAELTALGWQLHTFGIDNQSVWLIWHGPREQTLCMVDSHSWWPASLERIGAAMGMAKLDLPDDDGPALEARCIRDVQILGAAWRTLVDWLAAEHLGPWRMSGSSQSWAAWRRRFYPERGIFIRDPANVTGLREFERRAAWTGRTEAWRHGVIRDVAEWDYRHAYASVARDEPLAREQWGYDDRLDLKKWQRLRDNGDAILSVVDLETSAPVVPAQGPAGIYWPVGRFRTVLWDCELAAALDAGAKVRIGSSTFYELGDALGPMAAWICAILDGNEYAPPVLAGVVKHWSRALIGRSAMRFPKWRRHIEAVPAGLDDAYPPYELALRDDPEAGIRRTLRVGDTVFADVGDTEPADAAPFLQSHVMALARVRLWRAMQAAGLDHVAYVDTDSLIVDQRGDRRLAAAHLPDLERKERFSLVEILGPRQLYLDGRLRMAGLPGARDAKRVGPATYDVEVWPTLTGSLGAGEHDRVTIRRERVTVRGVDDRRRHLPAGATLPHVAELEG